MSKPSTKRARQARKRKHRAKIARKRERAKVRKLATVGATSSAHSQGEHTMDPNEKVQDGAAPQAGQAAENTTEEVVTEEAPVQANADAPAGDAIADPGAEAPQQAAAPEAGQAIDDEEREKDDSE